MKYCVLIPTLAVFASCGHGEQVSAGLGDIFNRDSVELVLHTNVAQKPAADQYYKDGERKLRKEKQPAEAITLFTNSIKAYPSARVYFELGNAYMNATDYPNAIKAYEMAETMDYRPLSKLLYNTACAYSLSKDKKWMAADYLEYAIESGYKNTAHMTEDPDLNDIQRGFAYDDSYMDAMSGAEDPVEVVWNRFKKAFAIIALPVTIDKQSDSKLTYDHMLSSKFGKYVNEMQVREKFSREGGDAFYGFAQVAENAHYRAIIYASNSEMEESAANYWMVSYDPKGTLIDKMNIAGQRSGTSIIKVCTINQDLSFEVKTFQSTYQKPPEEAGYYENPVVSTTLTETKDYKIDDAGKFIEVSPRIGMR